MSARSYREVLHKPKKKEVSNESMNVSTYINAS